MFRRIFTLLTVATFALALNGCLAAAAGAGAAAGYHGHKQGYRVQSPITKP